MDKEEQEKREKEREEIKDFGEGMLDENEEHHKIFLLSIIGEIEGHETAGNNSKTTKYEHVLPQLAKLEDSNEYDGMLVIINTMGGDVEAGLAIAEMISSVSKPTVSLVLGGSHSIGGPIAVSADYSFIVPSGTMVIHPVRMNGMFIGAPQTYDYFKLIQDRISGFIERHSKVTQAQVEEMMMNTGILTKDLGTILVGQEAVEIGLIDELGGISQAMDKLHQLIEINMDEEQRKKENKDHTQTTEN